MKIEKVKISQLPQVKTLEGFSTIGVGPDGKSYRAELGFVENAADNANAAAEAASSAADSALSASREADLSANNANTAAAGASAAAQQAEGSVLELAQIGARVDENSQDIADLQQQVVLKSNSTPLMDGTAGAGSQNAYAAGDHRHPTDTTRAALGYVDAELAKKQNTLTAGANISINGNTISATGIDPLIVTITDFNTFNPSSLGLEAGESCNFSSYGATGTPPTRLTVYGWSGTVTRIYSNYYRITAMSMSGTDAMPQMATRLYYGSTVYNWQLIGDDLYSATTGYTKLPSGLMIQWGKGTMSTGKSTVYFNTAFYSTTGLTVITTVNQKAESITAYGNRVASYTTTYFTAEQAEANSSNQIWSNAPFFWIAIGRWK